MKNVAGIIVGDFYESTEYTGGELNTITFGNDTIMVDSLIVGTEGRLKVGKSMVTLPAIRVECSALM